MGYLPSSKALVSGVVITFASLAVWEMWGRDFVSGLRS
jgi:hypothetical protein